MSLETGEPAMCKSCEESRSRAGDRQRSILAGIIVSALFLCCSVGFVAWRRNPCASPAPDAGSAQLDGFLVTAARNGRGGLGAVGAAAGGYDNVGDDGGGDDGDGGGSSDNDGGSSSGDVAAAGDGAASGDGGDFGGGSGGSHAMWGGSAGSRARAAAAGAPPKQTYFVVESYGPVTDAMAEVHVRVARQLENVAEVWVNYDSTCRALVPGEAYKKHKVAQCEGNADLRANVDRLRALAAAEPNLHVSFFSDYSLEQRYPKFRWLREEVFQGQEPVYDVPYLGLSMWLRQLIDEHGIEPDEMGNVYVAENDVLFAGDLALFVRGTEELQGEMDFLTTKVHNQTQTAHFKHVWKQSWPVPTGKLLSAEQFVYRLSPWLLLTLEDRLTMNIVGYGEMFAVTTCDTSFWCSWDVFKLAQHATQSHDNKSCAMTWDCRISFDRWQKISADPTGRNLFYHACKFLTDSAIHGVFSALDRSMAGGHDDWEG